MSFKVRLEKGEIVYPMAFLRGSKLLATLNAIDAKWSKISTSTDTPQPEQPSTLNP